MSCARVLALVVGDRNEPEFSDGLVAGRCGPVGAIARRCDGPASAGRAASVPLSAIMHATPRIAARFMGSPPMVEHRNGPAAQSCGVRIFERWALRPPRRVRDSHHGSPADHTKPPSDERPSQSSRERSASRTFNPLNAGNGQRATGNGQQSDRRCQIARRLSRGPSASAIVSKS